MQQQATLIFITKLYVKYLVPAKVTIMVADLLKYIATLAVHSELPTAYTLAVMLTYVECLQTLVSMGVPDGQSRSYATLELTW